MEKYVVVRTENEGFAQWLVLKNMNPIDKKLQHKQVYSMAGFFKIGDVISRYVGFNGDILAESYKLGRYRFVDFGSAIPKNDFDLEHFYADLDFCDRIKLKWDVAQALRSYGIKPSLSAQKNLRMLALGLAAHEKVR